MDPSNLNYPWYQAVTGLEVQQGDIVENYEIVSAHDANTNEIIKDVYNLIIMTQSCDILKPKTRHLVMCPIFTFDELAREWPDINDPRGRNQEKLRKGEIINFCLLNQCQEPGMERPFRVVSFKRIFETPKASLEKFIGQNQRLRLQPPYREYLSQSFARFFMRVGLPLDLPRFDRR